MNLATAHQPTGYIGRLQQCALGWKVSPQIARGGNKDVSALVAVAPFPKLPHTRLEHLVSMKAGIFPEERLRECRDQCLGRVVQGEIAGDQPGRSTDLLLSIKSVEQGSANLVGGERQVGEAIAALAGQ